MNAIIGFSGLLEKNLQNEEKAKEPDEEVEVIDIVLYESSDGQLMFC